MKPSGHDGTPPAFPAMVNWYSYAPPTARHKPHAWTRQEVHDACLRAIRCRSANAATWPIRHEGAEYRSGERATTSPSRRASLLSTIKGRSFECRHLSN